MTNEVFECYLPNNKESEYFAALSNEDKTKVISLGILFLNEGNKKLQCWNNDEWEFRLQKQSAEYDEEKLILLNELKREKQEKRDLQNYYKKQKEDWIREIEQNEKIKYEKTIADLKEDLTQTDKSKRDIMEELRNVHTKLTDKYEGKLAEMQCKIDKLHEEYEKKLTKEKDKYENTLIRANNSTIKGQDGEEFTFHELNLRFPSAEIEDCHKTKGRGDFILKEGDLIMMIENKNYTTNVNNAEINKFYRDMKDERNSDIMCGILMSLNSGICQKPDFTFEVVGGKPVIFLHKMRDNMHNLALAVKFFQLIFKQKDLDLTNIEVENTFKNCAVIMKRSFNKQKTQLDKFHSEQLAGLTDIQDNVLELFGLVNIKY